MREKLGSYESELPKGGFETLKARMLAAEAERGAEAARVAEEAAGARKVTLRRNWLRGAAAAASLAAVITAGVLLMPDKAGVDVKDASKATVQVAETVASEKASEPVSEGAKASGNNIVKNTTAKPIHIVSVGHSEALAQATPEESAAMVAEPVETAKSAGFVEPAEVAKSAETVEPADVSKSAETTEVSVAESTPVRTIYDQPAAEPQQPVKPVRKQLQRFSLGASGMLATNSGRNNGDAKQYMPNGMMVTTDKLGNKYYSFGAPELHYNYSAPVSAGISLRYDITNRLYAETGLRFTYLSTTVEPSGARQDLLFAGIPLGVGCTLFEWGNLDLYGSAYGMPSKCVWGREGPSFPANISGIEDVPLMWSAGIAPGVQYTFGGLVSLYAEPTLSYYFKNDKAPETLYKENPFYFTVNLGIRFNL